jgi:monoterpene epsilon-lactone hydrolase
MPSDQAAQFANFYQDLRTRFSKPDLDLTTLRDIVETMHVATKEPEGVSYAEVDAGGVEALWCIPADSTPGAVLLHCHMGGTVVDSMYSERKAAAHLARAAGARALVLNFRRSPEHKWPAQIEDVENAYGWLLDEGYLPKRIASVGNSIGANFAVSLALRLRERGAELPGALLAVSPWFDTTLTNDTIDSNADSDKLLSRGLLEFFRSSWLDGTDAQWGDPQLNLLAANLTGLPPIAVYYGADELLAGESVEFARLAGVAGNDVLLREVPAGQHSFIMSAGWVPETDHAITEMGAWLRARLSLDPKLAMAE